MVINDLVSTFRYFFSSFIHLQLYEGLCKRQHVYEVNMHNCDLYGAKYAGGALKWVKGPFTLYNEETRYFSFLISKENVGNGSEPSLAWGIKGGGGRIGHFSRAASRLLQAPARMARKWSKRERNTRRVVVSKYAAVAKKYNKIWFFCSSCFCIFLHFSVSVSAGAIFLSGCAEEREGAEEMEIGGRVGSGEAQPVTEK